MPGERQPDYNASTERSDEPLYRIVSKFTPIRLGSRKVSRCESHVPSPTWSVFDEYVLLPGGVRPGPDILMVFLQLPCDLELWNVGCRRRSTGSPDPKNAPCDEINGSEECRVTAPDVWISV